MLEKTEKPQVSPLYFSFNSVCYAIPYLIKINKGADFDWSSYLGLSLDDIRQQVGFTRLLKVFREQVVQPVLKEFNYETGELPEDAGDKLRTGFPECNVSEVLSDLKWTGPRPY